MMTSTGGQTGNNNIFERTRRSIYIEQLGHRDKCIVMPTELITTEDAGRRLGVSARTVRRWLKIGRVKGRKLGENGHWRIEWDTRLMGSAIVAPVNEFIKKSCIRHGGTIANVIEWSSHGNVGRELKIVIQGINREDCIEGIRKLSGGLTMDELTDIGVCTQCVGYTWENDTTLPQRRTVHGQRDELDRDDEHETVKILRKIEQMMREHNTIPSSPVNPTPYRYDQSPSWAWRHPQITVPQVTGTVLNVSNNTAATVNVTASSAWGVSGADSNSNYVHANAGNDGETVTIATSGMVFLSINTSGVEVGDILTADDIAGRMEPTVREGDGAYVDITGEGFRVHGMRGEQLELIDEDDEEITPQHTVTPGSEPLQWTTDISAIMNRFPHSEWEGRLNSYMAGRTDELAPLTGDHGEEYEENLRRRNLVNWIGRRTNTDNTDDESTGSS